MVAMEVKRPPLPPNLRRHLSVAPSLLHGRPGSATRQKQVLMRKARRADVRGAGPWPTGVLEASRTEPVLRRVPWRTKRTRFRYIQISGFWPARRREAMRTRCTPQVRTAREPPDTERSLRRAPWNAAGQVPLPTKKQVLMRKARRADVYWSTLGPAERSASGSATSLPRRSARYGRGGCNSTPGRCLRWVAGTGRTRRTPWPPRPG